MDNILNTDIEISKITLSALVKSKHASIKHRNRRFHGLIFVPKAYPITYRFIGTEEIIVDKGSIIYLPKGSDYDAVSDIQAECYAINFECRNDSNFKPFKIKSRNFEQAFSLFKQAELVFLKRDIGYEYKCKSILYDIIYTIIKDKEASYIPSSKSKLLLSAIDYVAKNYTKENISVKYLAQMSGVSDCYFRRIFKDVYNTNPVRYIQNLKIRHAKELIDSGLYSTLHEISFLSGYNDDCHFSREFNRIVGISPSEYKKNSSN